MKFTIIILTLVSILLSGCHSSPLTSDQVQRQQQEAIAAQGNAVVGMPAIVNYQEKRILKDIYEMRDNAIVTITYTQDMNGNLHKLCDSIGYGIPTATQYTNPMKIVNACAGANCPQVLPQADPNGLFSPSSAEGTWVICKAPNGTKTSPVYSEPRIIVSSFALK
jgi:hypothetical protein